MRLPLPPLPHWTLSDFSAVFWDGSILHIWATGQSMAPHPLIQRRLDPIDRRSDAVRARRVLGTASTAVRDALLAALWPLFEDGGSALALPGAAAKACFRGATCALAVRPDAPAATFVLPGTALIDDVRRLLHPAVPEGDHVVPRNASAHERLDAARTWGPDLPPALDGVGWRRIRHGRAVALVAFQSQVPPTVMGLRVLP